MPEDLKQRHLNYLRRNTADESELWVADRIEQLEKERDDLALIIATDTGTESAVADLQRQLVVLRTTLTGENIDSYYEAFHAFLHAIGFVQESIDRYVNND